jgi:hypothetical protein
MEKFKRDHEDKQEKLIGDINVLWVIVIRLMVQMAP